MERRRKVTSGIRVRLSGRCPHPCLFTTTKFPLWWSVNRMTMAWPGRGMLNLQPMAPSTLNILKCRKSGNIINRGQRQNGTDTKYTTTRKSIHVGARGIDLHLPGRLDRTRVPDRDYFRISAFAGGSGIDQSCSGRLLLYACL